MITKKITPFSKEYPKHKALYQTAFPVEEQYPMWAMHLLTLHKKIDLLAFYEGDKFCGMSFTSRTKGMLYILYIAVEEELRCNGYGSRMLEYLKEKYPADEVTLNIEFLDPEAENYEERKRRMAFYLRNGYRETGYKLVDTTGEYVILSTSDNFSRREFVKSIRMLGMDAYRPKVVEV